MPLLLDTHNDTISFNVGTVVMALIIILLVLAIVYYWQNIRK